MIGSHASEVNSRAVAGYLFSPQIGQGLVPVMQAAGWIFPVIAMILIDVGLIPRAHPTAVRGMRGEAGFGELIAVAVSNVTLRWQSLPQIVMLSAIIGLVACAVITLVLIGFGTTAAFAQMSLFEANDIAKGWLDQLFGVGGAGIPTNAAFPTMLATYSNGCLVLAGIIVTYSAGVIVLETATTGVFFGKRHSMVWAPVRLIFALGLLAPIGGGYNSGQLVVLKIAEWGSGLGTNVWTSFAEGILTGDMPLVYPNPPTMDDLVATILMSEVCKGGLDLENMTQIAASTGSGVQMSDPANHAVTVVSQDLTRESTMWEDAGNIFTLNWSSVGDAVVIGTKEVYMKMDTQDSICGEIHYNAEAYDSGGSTLEGYLRNDSVPAPSSPPMSAAQAILSAHETTVANARGRLRAEAMRLLSFVHPAGPNYEAGGSPQIDLGAMTTDFARDLAMAIGNAINAMQGQTDERIGAEIRAYGWIGAATFFHRIARVNAAIIDASSSLPTFVKPNDGLVEDVSPETYDAMARVRQRLQVYLAQRGNVSAQNAALRDDVEESKGRNASVEKILSGIRPSSTLIFNFDSPNPLNEISNLGHWLVGLALVMMTVGLVLDVIPWFDASGFAGFLFTVSGIILSAGFTLGMVLPLIPAIRFTFGILTWLVAIFEGLIAVPILALAHLRTDGEGLMGPLAQKGYFMMLQIFLRPTLMVFGLVVALMCFNTIIGIMNQIFVPAIIDAQGGLGIFSTLFMSIYYCIVCYTLANACFKIIDMMPNEILRWIGGDAIGDLDSTNETQHMMMAAAGSGMAMASAGHSASASMGSQMRNHRQQNKAKAQHEQEQGETREFRSEVLNNLQGMQGGGGGGGGDGGDPQVNVSKDEA